MSKIQPFLHDELELKRKFREIGSGLIDKAKDPNTEIDDEVRLAYELAGGLIYANFAEYLISHLVNSLDSIAEDAVKKAYSAHITVAMPNLENKPIEGLLKQLEMYEFPRKKEIVGLSREIKKQRNKISHEIIKTSGSRLETIDDAVYSIAKDTEELIEEMDLIYRGLPPVSLLE